MWALHIVMVRRRGRQWFIDGMTGDKPYDDQLALSFLPKGEYVIHILALPTGPKANYETPAMTNEHGTAGDPLDLHMRLADGVAIYLEPVSARPA